MHLIEINGCTFYTDRERKHFLKKRSYRLDKKLYTGKCLTLLHTIKVKMSKEHQDRITNKLISKGFEDIDDAILSISYNGYFKSRNNNHYLGMMGSSYDRKTGMANITSLWEILSPNKEIYEANLHHLIARISEMLEIKDIIVLKAGEETDYTDKYDASFAEYNGDVIGYDSIPSFVLD